MSKVRIPDNPGRFHVQTGMAGNWMVFNDRTGKKKVIIPCRSQDEADELCRRLNSGDHPGEVHVPNHV